MTQRNLLVELFVEELPPKALKKLGHAFAAALFEQIQVQGLASPESRAHGIRLAAPAGGSRHGGFATQAPDQIGVAEADAG